MGFVDDLCFNFVGFCCLGCFGVTMLFCVVVECCVGCGGLLIASVLAGLQWSAGSDVFLA